MLIDCDFPGGNILVERVEGDTAYVRQDLRDTTRNWFYWSLRVRHGGGRTLRFIFTASRCIGVFGPAMSFDGGATWRWLGKESVQGNGFVCVVPTGCDDARFAYCIPYVEAHLRRWQAKWAGHPALVSETLCRFSKNGGPERAVERLRLGCVHSEPRFRVLLTARHHCSETVGNYVLEGLLDAILEDGNLGEWYCKSVEVCAIPFMDKHGVECGDPGKDRAPHDHGRDYTDKPIYPEVAALQKFLPQWSAGQMRVHLDLHCPNISGRYSEEVYWVGRDDPSSWNEMTRFGAILERLRAGPLPYYVKDNIPWGTGWNFSTPRPASSANWTARIPGMCLAGSIELPYSSVYGVEVNETSARALGRDLATALQAYLQLE